MSSGDGAQSEFEHGNRLARAGELNAAEAAYRRADELGHPTAAAYVGLLSEGQGRRAQALEDYRRADERGDGLGAFRLGLLLSSAGDWKAADAAWRRAGERDRHEPPFDLHSVLPATPNGNGAAPHTPQPTHQSAFASPVLVGAVTVLVVLVAVFLAYNANQGLPFVPTRELRVDVADGSDLVIGNDVREGGYRIGLLSDMKPIELANGAVGAQLTLQLNESNGKVPVDSRIAVRPLSVLGLKYVDLQRGTSSKVFGDGATMPISQTSVPVQFDDLFKTFDANTRGAIQRSLVGGGDTLAARGSDLNDTIASLPELFGHLRPVAAYLAAPDTGLTRFFNGLNAFVAGIAPVANVNADLFGRMASTFAAISNNPRDLEQTIQQSPSTLSVGTDSLRTQQPFLVDLMSVGQNLRPATVALAGALPQINPAIEAGTKTLARTPALNARLQHFMDALRQLAQAPETNIAVNALAATVQTLNPMIRYLGPFQTVCDYWNYWWTYLSEHLSAQTSYGYAQRALVNLGAIQGNGVGQQGAYAPANNTPPGLPIAGGTEFLHAQPYGAAIDNSGNADCEAGQRGYPLKVNAFDPQGRNLAVDPHTPMVLGTTYNGRSRVPSGETFSRDPQTGPQLATP